MLHSLLNILAPTVKTYKASKISFTDEEFKPGNNDEQVQYSELVRMLEGNPVVSNPKARKYLTGLSAIHSGLNSRHSLDRKIKTHTFENPYSFLTKDLNNPGRI